MKLMLYSVDYFKTENLTPDEMNAMRKNARGIWIDAGMTITASSPAEACRKARKGWLRNHPAKIRARI